MGSRPVYTPLDMSAYIGQKVLLDFVKNFKPEDAVYYDQAVEGKRLIRQRVQIKCAKDRKTLDLEVARLMQQHGIRRDNSRYDHEVFYGSDAQSGVYQVWVLTDQGNQSLDLTISTERLFMPTAVGRIPEEGGLMDGRDSTTYIIECHFGPTPLQMYLLLTAIAIAVIGLLVIGCRHSIRSDAVRRQRLRVPDDFVLPQ